LVFFQELFKIFWVPKRLDEACHRNVKGGILKESGFESPNLNNSGAEQIEAAGHIPYNALPQNSFKAVTDLLTRQDAPAWPVSQLPLCMQPSPGLY
jgi:hypothetical protein